MIDIRHGSYDVCVAAGALTAQPTERNRRRAARRRLLRLRVRREYIKVFVADERNDVVEGWITTVRAHGRLPAGTLGDAALAARIEQAVRRPFKELERVQHKLRTFAGASHALGPVARATPPEPTP